MVFADNQEGGAAMSHYRHLSIEEREKLYLRRGQGANLREIARELGRAASTISRELKRNERARHPYSPSQAQKSYEKRRKKCGRKHILCDSKKREYIHRFIQEAHWSPEQISNRLKLESAQVQVSYYDPALPASILSQVEAAVAPFPSFCHTVRSSPNHSVITFPTISAAFRCISPVTWV